MRALVLGGTQFVGRAVAEGLIARGWDVSVLTRGRLPVEYGGLSRRYRAERREPASLRVLEGERFDAVVDVSAYAGADVRPVLEALRPGEGTRYVLVSSGAVYRPSVSPLAEDAPVGENEHWGPYGLGKLEAERLLADCQPTWGYALSIVRPAYLYGPGNNLLREAYLFDRLERGLPVPVPGGGARGERRAAHLACRTRRPRSALVLPVPRLHVPARRSQGRAVRAAVPANRPRGGNGAGLCLVSPRAPAPRRS